MPKDLILPGSLTPLRRGGLRGKVGRENFDLVGDGCEQNSTATDLRTNSGISDSKVLSSIGLGFHGEEGLAGKSPHGKKSH